MYKFAGHNIMCEELWKIYKDKNIHLPYLRFDPNLENCRSKELTNDNELSVVILGSAATHLQLHCTSKFKLSPFLL